MNTSFLSRIGQNWNNFWFKPGNPHTLSLMRVMAGIFVVYLHLAYTNDLQTFFGEHGWIDLKLAQEVRNGFPVYPPQTDWTAPTTNMYAPVDKQVRTTFFEWLRTLPADRQKRKDQLAFFYLWMSAEPQAAVDGIAFIQRLRIKLPEDRERATGYEGFDLVDPAERQRMLEAITNPPADPIERNKLVPQYIQKLDKDSYAERVRADAERTAASLPSDPKKIAQIMNHLAYQATVRAEQKKHSDPRNEFERTMQFIDEDLPNDAVERERILDYFGRWQIDERKLLAKGQNSWSIWYHVTNPTAMYVIHSAFLAVMVMFTLGLFTRVTSVLTWMAALCYVHRTSQVLFGMDVMMNICLTYLMFAPCASVLSLDRWLAVRKARRQLEEARRTGKDTRSFEAILSGPAPSVSANFVTRLFQVHFCFIYMAAGLSKLKGNAWWNHTALWGTIANPEFSPTVFAPYRWALTQLCEFRSLWELFMTGGVVFTLILEIGLPFLIWRPRLRPYLIIALVLFHTVIAIFMGLTVFGLFMMTLGMSFLSPEVVRRWIDSGMNLFSRGTEPPAAILPPSRVPVAGAEKLKA